MIYFNYKVAEATYELNEDEHKQILEAIAKGRTGLVVLRGGELIFNLAFIRSIQVDEESVKLQAQGEMKQLSSFIETPENKAELQEKIKKIKEELSKKLNW